MSATVILGVVGIICAAVVLLACVAYGASVLIARENRLAEVGVAQVRPGDQPIWIYESRRVSDGRVRVDAPELGSLVKPLQQLAPRLTPHAFESRPAD